MKNLPPLFLFAFLFLSSFCIAQIKIIDHYYKADSLLQIADTVFMFDSARNIDYCDYHAIFYNNSNCVSDSSSYASSEPNLSYQDSLVFDTLGYYIKYYRSNKTLMWEGLKHPHGYLIGDIKFYYESGKLERVEHRNSYIYKVRDYTFHVGDAPVPSKLWKYYDKKGRLFRTVEYRFRGAKPLEAIQYIIEEKLYSKRGKLKETNITFP